MHKGFLKTAALLGALSVILGAFAAHKLKEMLSEHAVSTFETAVRYQFYHVFALFIVAIVYKDFRSATTLWAGRLFVGGIILFSGSLYVLAIVQAMEKPGFGWVGPLTPVGGVLFIAGWICLCVSFFRRN